MKFKSLMTTCVFLAALVSLPKSADALTYSGRVERVVDGDTLSLATDARELVRIRLSDIDAPENGQAYGRAAKRELQNLVRGRRIVARVNDTDRYGRAVARIDREGLDVNAEMVRRGAAWAYARYQTDGRFARWERGARAAKLGLWSTKAGKPVSPSDWRAERRGVTSVRTTAQALRLTLRDARGPSSSFTCGKRLCRQMVSCAEAVFSLRQCGMGRLDGDGDGKPCESLCS